MTQSTCTILRWEDVTKKSLGVKKISTECIIGYGSRTKGSVSPQQVQLCGASHLVTMHAIIQRRCSFSRPEIMLQSFIQYLQYATLPSAPNSSFTCRTSKTNKLCKKCPVPMTHNGGCPENGSHMNINSKSCQCLK